jgi:exodeoxyribonuclease VII large subunit
MKQYTLLELNQAISEILNLNLEPSYWVIAEVSQVQVNQKGHCYLELIEKEEEQIKAKMRATIWSYTYRNLITWFEKMTRQSLKPGMKILFNATVQYHEVFGMSLNIKDIDANYTLGEGAKKKAETIEQLREDGVFDMNKQLSLPLVPQRIAIISSSTAAGYGDFMNQLSGNQYSYRFGTKLFNSSMQGQEAESSIIAALHQIFTKQENYDLVVMIRGGGSTTDLDCFDSYELSSHVAQFPLPVITGIGHDRDETICDMVAHTRLKTPTAVSEFIISGVKNYEDQLDQCMMEIYQVIKQKVSEESLLLERISSRLHRSYQNKASQYLNQIEKLELSLQNKSTNYLEDQLYSLQTFENKIQKEAPKIVSNHQKKIAAFENLIKAVDPVNILNRGFTITKINGSYLKNYQDKINKGDQLMTITNQHQITSEITESIKNNSRHGN